jgi:hypothetical protein
VNANPPGSKQEDDEFSSPCVGTCRMEGEYCVGCYRTIGDIVGWIFASKDEKRAILAAAEERRCRLDPNACPRPDHQD